MRKDRFALNGCLQLVRKPTPSIAPHGLEAHVTVARGAFVALLTILLFASGLRAQTSRENLLWYKQSGEKWVEGMPLGNGFIGAMVFGKPEVERIALNEGTFWSGRPHDYNAPDAHKYFDAIRELVFAGKFQEAEKLADTHFWGTPANQQAFQPLGDLMLNFDGIKTISNYRRELDISTGVARITFESEGATFTREIFVSNPDHVLVVSISCDKPGRVTLGARMKSPYLDSFAATGSSASMNGTWKGPMPPAGLIATVTGTGLKFEAKLEARLEGGTTDVQGDSLRIEGANAATLVLTAATSFVNYHDISADPAAACEKVLSACAKTDYPALLRRHVEDFSALMNRVHLKVGDESRNDIPTDQRLREFKQGKDDPDLEAKAFQFGRYLLASSSRAGGQPANLQGIWNEQVTPPWGSKYTININTQMNYWPAEVCNLSECHQPLFDMLKDISVTGAETARIYYDHGGWVTHHNVDLWRGTAPVDAARFGMWPVGGAWLCQHLWEHYAYTNDREFLKAYYPIMRGSAQFLLELLVEDPKHHWLVSPFSMSPEHGYYDADGKMAFLSPAPTMDVAIMRELFPHCIEAAKTLGVDAEFSAKLSAALEKLPPYQINHLGFLQEWIDDWKPGAQGHNVSPNFTFFPGRSITLRGDPEHAAAIGRWMEARKPRGAWPTAWDTAVWARLERGDKVALWLKTLISNSIAINMQNTGSNQSDANFGLTAAVAEALLQSHDHEISLLPALPAGWDVGSVSGLKARGNYTVDMQWQAGKLQSASIHGAPGVVKVRSGQKTAQVTIPADGVATLSSDLSVKH